MPVDLADIASEAGGHVVQFYEDESELARTVGRYLSDAVRDGAIGLAIAAEEHRVVLEAGLRSAGVDPASARRDGTLIWLDAADTMSGFMPDGRVDGEAFRRVVGSVVSRAVATGRPVRAFGEMVGLLWEDGNVLAAIELEELWNDLRSELSFSLLCCYRSDPAHREDHAPAIQRVCDLHTSVLHRARCDGPRSASAEVTAQFAAERGAPRSARHFVTDALTGWGHAGVLLEDAQLLVTELATNAVVHARSPFSVVARADGSCLRLSVHDASTVRPTIRIDGPTVSSGRGIRLVAALSADWGVDVTADGKTVWAELAMPHRTASVTPQRAR